MSERVNFLALVIVWLVVGMIFSGTVFAARLARLKYDGGGDWYNNPEVLPNLARFINREIGTSIEPRQVVVEPGSEKIFKYPFVYLTGHGNISFTDQQIHNLRNYLLSGGFLYADDDYGMDQSFRREMERLFPEHPLVQLEADHPLFEAYYDFSAVPRIHEHNLEEPPRVLGIKVDGEWVVLYTYNTNISDGWAEPETHGNPPAVRNEALKFGTNIYLWMFSQ